MVLLIGNYQPDQQQSMQRFSQMMLRELCALGVHAKLVQPKPRLIRLLPAPSLLAKWAGYFDKLIVFPIQLRARELASVSLVHICDHSNAVYVMHVRKVPVVVTCHDLLAVRGGLGEETDCPATVSGKLLQRWILRGLRGARTIACVSQTTAADAIRLVGERNPITVIPNGLNYDYRPLSREARATRLASIKHLKSDRPFVLHVGSNLKRKNREGVLRIFAKTKDAWNAQLVFAGDALSTELSMQARDLGLLERIVQIVSPDAYLLEALYSQAHALLFPSRFEGFGWPIIEAQACGCPVLCSSVDPMAGVAGDAGLLHAVSDENLFAEDLLRLRDEATRNRYRALSLQNATRFSAREMAERYVALYRKLGAAA